MFLGLSVKLADLLSSHKIRPQAQDVPRLPLPNTGPHGLKCLTPGLAATIGWVCKDAAREHEQLAPVLSDGRISSDVAEGVVDQPCPGIPGPFRDMMESGGSRRED